MTPAGVSFFSTFFVTRTRDRTWFDLITCYTGGVPTDGGTDIRGCGGGSLILIVLHNCVIGISYYYKLQAAGYTLTPTVGSLRATQL